MRLSSAQRVVCFYPSCVWRIEPLLNIYPVRAAAWVEKSRHPDWIISFSLSSGMLMGLHIGQMYVGSTKLFYSRRAPQHTHMIPGRIFIALMIIPLGAAGRPNEGRKLGKKRAACRRNKCAWWRLKIFLCACFAPNLWRKRFVFLLISASLGNKKPNVWAVS